MITHVIDIYHGDPEPDWEKLKAAGIQGVIFKATEGAHYVDPDYHNRYINASKHFDTRVLHSYHMLNGEDPVEQIRNYLTATQGKPGRWLDYEKPETLLQCALDACHALADKQGRFPGMYGSDKGQLGDAIDAGHFAGACEIWIARYGAHPTHACHLWQFQAAEVAGVQKIAGEPYDASTYLGNGDCASWMKSLAS